MNLRRRSAPAIVLSAMLPLVFTAPLSAEGDQGIVKETVARFAASDFEFQRSISNAPFPPLAFLSGTSYSDVEAESPEGVELEYSVNRVSQLAAVPILLGKRDALVVGEYLSWSEFDVEGEGEFSVGSVGLPIGWMRQANPDWQLAAFVMPLGHKTDLDNSDWDWQYLGGGFARYIQSDNLWWAFGMYFDVGSEDDVYIPYLGASWAINERWTLSAIMPWPALIYAPSSNLMLRLGAAPSGASWRVDLEEAEVGVNLDAWDFGLGAEYRVFGNAWIGAEAGVGGLRGLQLADGDVEEPDLDFSSNAYLRLTLKYRPAMRP